MSDEATPDDMDGDDELIDVDMDGGTDGAPERLDMECLVWAICELHKTFGGNFKKATIEALECAVVSVAGKISSRPLSE